MREPFKEHELQAGALVRRQLPQEVREPPATLVSFPRHCFFIPLFERGFAPAGRALLPQPLEAARACNPEKPAADRAILRAVQSGFSRDLEKDLLKDLFSEAPAAQNPVQQPQGRRGQAVEELRKGFAVTVSNAAKEEPLRFWVI